MRLSGFASGLDIDTMVKTLMKAHQAPLTKLKQQTTKIEWQQEAYRSVSTSLVDFRNNKLSNYSLSSAINAKKADVSGNTTAVSATTQGNTADGVYNVKVTSLASASSVVATTAITGDNAKVALSDLQLGLSGLTGKVKIGNTEIAYDQQTDTLQSLIDKINQHKGANVTVLYDATAGKISATSKATGDRDITLGGDFEKLLTADSTELTEGKNAKATVNGIDFESETNQISVNGLNIQLKTTHALDSMSTITVSTDTNKTMDTIKSFINDYNSLLEKINGKLGEEKYRNYSPLTEEEREAISDKQAELWDDKAKSGLLKNDTILSTLVSNMRIATIANFGPDTDKFNIQSIGISTGKWYEGGKLVIEDEERLRKAIEEDPQKVMDLFTGRSSGTIEEGKSKINDPDAGIFTRLSNILMDSLVSLSEKAGTSQTSTSLTSSFLENSLLGTQKKDINSKISDYTRRLAMLETQYYKQFTAMETAINKYNSQAGSISSFLL